MDFRRLRTDLVALGLLGGCVFLGVALWSYDPADPPARMSYPPRAAAQNLAGPYGAVAAHYVHVSVGMGAGFLLFALVMMDLRLFSRSGPDDNFVRLSGVLLVLAGLCIALHLFAPQVGIATVVGSGGYVGAWGVALLEQYFTLKGIMILSGTAVVSGILISGELSLFRLAWTIPTAPLRALGSLARGREGEDEQNEKSKSSKHDDDDEHPATLSLADAKRSPAAPEAEIEKEEEQPERAAPIFKISAPEPVPAPAAIKINPPSTGKPARKPVKVAEPVDQEFELPSLDLLEQAEEFPYELLSKKAQAAAIVLEKTFKDFGLNVRVVEVDTGPVVTQFELELEAGLRLSKVAALADDLAIALRVPAVRVVQSIPGKNTVGVEVPNDKQCLVRLRELIESCGDAAAKMRIPLFLGKDVSGRPLIVDMAKMPHLLIAGRTGTGKSVCLNTLILSMLMTRSPDDVKMLMIDPKMVELSPYRRVPHLMHPVITDMKKAEAVLAWAVDKMEERYDLLAQVGVRHLDNYNKLGKEKVLEKLGLDADSEEAERIPDKMPYIVIVADEMADMMMTSGKDVEGHIIRLAQKSRAVGIHLVLATQKPTVDVITGLIKSNLPARISFQVSSRTDSRVVLDEMGAERLLGNGDMLYLAPGTSHLTRAQGTYVGDEEVNNIIEFYGDYEPQYSTELANLNAKSASAKADGESMKQRDDMYEQAVEVIIREGRGSVSLLQRALGVGYGRGARLIDYMAEDGIVGEYNGSQAREVLYTWEQWQSLKSGARPQFATAGCDDD